MRCCITVQLQRELQAFRFAASHGGRGIIIKDGKEVLLADGIVSDVQVFGDTRVGKTFGPFFKL